MLRKIKSVLQFSSSPALQLKDFILCIISAFFLIFSFPNFNLWFLAWVGFVPLFFALKGKSKLKAFLFAYLTGVVFWLGTIYWLVHVTLPGLILLVLYLAIYFGIFGLIFSTCHLLPNTYHLLFIPSLWVLLEYLRSHIFTGFGWALLGYSQYLNLPIIQIADITGVWGVSFLVMMTNVIIWQLINVASRKSQVTGREGRCLVLALSLLIASLCYGIYCLYLRPARHNLPSVRVSLIQGNIPQQLKWQKSSQSFILDRYIELSKQAALDKPDLIIWPEASVTGFLFESEDNWIFKNVFHLVKQLKTQLLFGSVVKDNSDFFNSAILVDSRGRIVKRYDKLHLVPFGEYIPLKKALPFLETIVPIGDFTKGKEYTIFKIQNSKFKIQNSFGVLICFEDLFPQLSRQFVKKGAEFLVNITNDAWYKQSPAAHQHLQASVLRAVENRVFLARCANTGVSALISPNGKIISCVQDKSGRQIFVQGFSNADVLISKRDLTFYNRYGDIFVLACFILVTCGIIIKKRKK